jgi:hypothetical protein
MVGNHASIPITAKYASPVLAYQQTLLEAKQMAGDPRLPAVEMMRP